MYETPHHEILTDIEAYLKSKDAIDKESAIDSIRRLLDREYLDLKVPDGEYRCMSCGGVDFVRNGRTAKGTQRWLCKNCGKSRCSPGTGNIMLLTKLPKEKWMEFAPLFVNHVPSTKVSEQLGVEQRTAWYMRIRVLEVLEKNLPSFQAMAGCGVQIDEMYFSESFKGTRFDDLEVKPREPRTGTDVESDKKGISNDKICVLTAVNDSGDFFYEVACRGALTSEVAMDSLRNRILSGAIVNTDKHHSYGRVLKELEVASHIAIDSKKHENLTTMDHIHSAISTFLRPFNGVSTKWLHLYLAWFKWLRCYDNKGSGKDNLLKQAFTGRYVHTYAAICGMGLPFRDASMRPTKRPY